MNADRTTTPKDYKFVESVSEYISYVFTLENQNDFFCYRGQSLESRVPEPSIARQRKNADVESLSLNELINEIPDEFQNDHTSFQKLMRSQHFGLPTRLLDVTMNPLVALFFACNSLSWSTNDGAVFIFDFKKDRTLNPDSDTLSILCNFAFLPESDKKNLSELVHSFAKDKNRKKNYRNDFDLFQNKPSYEKLVHLIRREKSYFLAKISPLTFLKYYFINSLKSNNRIIAQSGAFITAGLLNYRFTDDTKSFSMKKVIIPAKAKKTILADLEKLNITEKSLFPDIDHIAGFIKEKYAVIDGKSKTII